LVHGRQKTLAPRDSAISLVLSTLSESTTIISSAIPWIDSKHRANCVSSFKVIMVADIFINFVSENGKGRFSP
jgi:hypothetical protein